MGSSEAALLRTVVRAYAKAQNQMAACRSLSESGCKILCALGPREGQNQGELAQGLGLEKSWVSRAVDKLEEEGLLERRPCCDDGRKLELHLTPKGRRTHRGLEEALDTQAEDIMALLPASTRPELYRALGDLAEALTVHERLASRLPSSACGEPEGPRIRRAGPGEEARLKAHLEASGLPVAGLEAALPHLFVAEEGDRLLGCGGYEVHGTEALLRSVAVAPEARARGLGSLLVEAIEASLAARGFTEVYLLTATPEAEAFWRGRGYLPRPRTAYPPALEGSAELKGACPASAILMSKTL